MLMKPVNPWIEAMRLRTLPVSVAGVFMAVGYALLHGNFSLWPALICLAFAVAAQIASNFANEYFDYKAGRDRQGRQGPRRGVTEGDITPKAMLRAIILCLFIAGCLGLSLVAWGGWWLIPIGLLIAVGVFAYSTGPYPLSTHGLGEVAVVFFFGIIPVNLTYYVQALSWSPDVLLGSIAIGLMGANVLIINNYRDVDDDRSVNKITLAVRLGARAMPVLYMANAVVATALTFSTFAEISLLLAGIVALLYLLGAAAVVRSMTRLTGAALTPLLGITSILMFLLALTLLLAAI